MAKVFSAPPEWGWDEAFEFRSGEEWKDASKRYDAKLEEIESKHQVVRFPVADGYAMYAVYTRKPLQLIHIPYMDGYHANPILLRGLRLSDVDEMAESEKRRAKLFSKERA